MMLIPRRSGERHLFPWRTPWEEMLDTDFGRMQTAGSLGTFPKVDIRETDKTVIVTADVPGMEAKNINLSVAEDTFTISGRMEGETKEKDKTCWYEERFYGEFHRSFTLPAKVDADGVEAKLRNGVLTVTMKKKMSVVSQEIKVQEG